MKKLFTFLAAVSMLVAPTVAEARGRHNDGRHHRERGVSTGEAVAIGIGALILGAAISKNNRREREVVYQDYRTQVCQDIVKYDYYGNPYVAGRNCWYQ